MTPAAFATYIRFKTRTNSSTFTDAQILALANIRKDEIAREITALTGEDYFLREYKRDLEAGKRRYRFPVDIIGKVKEIELKLDGTNTVVVTEFDLAGWKRPTTEADILAYFTDRNPQVDFFSDGIKIFSGSAIIGVTDGITIWAAEFPADITSLANTTDDMSIPSSEITSALPRKVHKLWADAVIIDYKQSKEKPIPLTEREQNWETDLDKAIRSLRQVHENREVKASYESDDGQDY